MTAVAAYGDALKRVKDVRKGRLAVAEPGLRVCKSPTFEGRYDGRVADGPGIVVSQGNELGNISVMWDALGDVTVWTRASDGVYDVITNSHSRRG